MPSSYFNPNKLETYSDTSSVDSVDSVETSQVDNNLNGGRISLPSSYFNPNKLETYSDTSSVDSVDSVETSQVNTKQNGGERLITGSTIPPNIITNVDNIINGVPNSHNDRSNVYLNNEIQLNNLNDNPIHYNLPKKQIQTSSFNSFNLVDTTNNQSITDYSKQGGNILSSELL